ncbi:hypothetical protein [Roseovarius indicus]|uniref:hypothetical protein n=1 Tax=Roseovarius indicus TaxID=540747 RepID=UPI0032EBECF5
MRDYDSATEAHLASLQGVVPRILVWIEAQNRTTGEKELAGFWNGLDTVVFSIGGEERVYAGAGALLGIEPVVATVGLEVRMHRLSLSEISPAVAQAVRGYDARLAPVEVHRAMIDPATNNLVGIPHRIIKGTVDSIKIPEGTEGESEPLSMTVADAGRSLTQTLTLKKSDATQRAISAADRGREYAAISGAVKVFWGRLQGNTGTGSTSASSLPISFSS